MTEKPGRDEQGFEVHKATSEPIEETVTAAAVGGAVGAISGPMSAAAGAVIGGALGWFESQVAAAGVDVASEIEFWKENYQGRYYYSKARSWTDFEPAYLTGIYFFKDGQDYEELRATMQMRWPEIRGQSTLSWDEASDASRDAWKRLALGKV